MTPLEIQSIEPALRVNYYGGFYTRPLISPATSTNSRSASRGLRAPWRFAARLISTEILSTAAGENDVTLVTRSTEPTLDDSLHPQQVETFDKVIVLRRRDVPRHCQRFRHQGECLSRQGLFHHREPHREG